MLTQVPGRRGNWALSGYDTAQICLEGHVINWFAESRQERNQDYCNDYRLCCLPTADTRIPSRCQYEFHCICAG